MNLSKKLIVAAAVIAASPVLFGGVPNLISYQGKLLNAGGAPITSATRMRFRLYRGGGGTEFPSLGALVYNETVVLTPTSEGVVSHLIGAGTVGTGCTEIPCAIAPDDFGDGTLSVWIEAMVDPDGTLNTADDDVLLPRTRVGTVGYAYRVASLDGAQGGALAGAVTATSVTATGGATLGSGVNSDISLRFDRAGTDPTMIWSESGGRFSLSHGLGVAGDVQFGNFNGLSWPTSYTRCTNYPPCTPTGTVNSRMSFGQRSDTIFNQQDNVFFWAYNYDLQSGGKVTPGEPMFKTQIETSFFDGASRTQLIEYNWDYQPAASTTQWRPLQFVIRTGGSGVGSDIDTADFEFRTCATCSTAKFTKSGTVEIGEFTSSPANVLTVRKTVPTATASQYGSKSIMDFQLDGAPAAAYEFVGAEGLGTWSGASAGNTVGAAVGSRGQAEISGGPTFSRSISNYLTGLEGRCWLTSTGAGPVNVSQCVGGRFQASAHGAGSAISVSALFAVVAASPATKGSGVTVNAGGGVLVEDQKGYGTGTQGAIVVSQQTGGAGSGTKGNVAMAGGGFDDGHLSLENGHLWYDKTNGRFRAKAGAPTSEGDGAAVVTGTGSTGHGLLKWGDGSNASFNTGNAVCQASGLTCVDVKTLGGADSNCSTTQGAVYFYALCR